MTHRTMISIAAAAALTALGASTALAQGGRTGFATSLTGYQETPVTLNSPGSGEFAAKISKDGTSIDYVLTYRDLPTTVQQSHIHFGRPALTGGIVLFLCTNLGNSPESAPAPPCPPSPATVTGTLTAANVVPVPGQGIHAGAAGLAEMIRAIRSGAAYVNVHTVERPPGEIRGALGHAHDEADDDEDED